LTEGTGFISSHIEARSTAFGNDSWKIRPEEVKEMLFDV
jgi:hypothetical protein